ncbi:hypothetical protein [Clostridium minihomine]|uniref:hypothetical protein n=1 Tax=Clostridium minihomine TaxID=2045012 RepID=UPI000C760065|nr:hypothetical protein [Clostridium minihomine]
MGLFEDVVINAKTAANAVGKKAGQLVDVSKLKISAAELNIEINKKYEALGKAVYDAKKADSDPADLVAEAMVAIDELQEQLDALNEQIKDASTQL